MIFTRSNFENTTDLKNNRDLKNYSQDPVSTIISPIEFVNTSANHIIKFVGVLFDPTPSFKSHNANTSSTILK
jgi:hypothetical protein